MPVERGFRRLTIVVSIVVLGLGAAFDAIIVLEPHATLRVTLEDGRKVILDRHGPKDFLSDRESLTRELLDRGELRPTDKLDARYPGSRLLTAITRVEMIRGPEYWWWADSIGTKVAAGLVGFLWIIFYTVRWIVCGFARS